MNFSITISEKALGTLKALKKNPTFNRRYKTVEKALIYLASNSRHPSLNTHEFKGLSGPRGERIFEAYAENNTPGAYRIFWYYGPNQGEITILEIIAHP